MAAGCPVLAYRIAGTADLITSGQDGVLVPPDDVAALARAAAELIADPDGRRRLARAGHALVRRDYDFDTALDRLAGLHAEVVQRHARRRGR
jgi:starch synthase